MTSMPDTSKIDTKKVMTALDACLIAEGSQPASEEETLQAWQYLIDTGLAWTLQGFYGRNAVRLIENGLCTTPNSPRSKERLH